MYACLHAPGNLHLLVECARHFSPLMEEDPPDSVVFDARGLESLYGPPDSLARAVERRVGVPANIAIAANPDAALHAARGFHGITVIERGREAVRLAPLSLNLLGGSPEMAELLDLWGVRTFGAFAKLPPLGVAARLGDEGMHLWRLARGEGYRRLQPIVEALQFEAEMELDYPVEILEALSFVLARLLHEVCGRLAGRALATNEIRLRLTLENAPAHTTVLRLPLPMLDAKAFLKMLQLDLNGRPPAAAVLKVHLAAEPVKPRRTQHGLFLPAAPEAEKLEVTLARIRHLVGEENVGSPEIRNTHRPDNFVMRPFAPPPAETCALPEPVEPRLGLRRYRPPRYAQVMVAHCQPVRIVSPAVTGPVVTAKGPWKTSGDWWKTDAWSRDEWDIEVERGGLYRVFRETESSRWFIEGTYD